MDAIVTQAFVGVPDGRVYGRPFEPGETVSGDLAELAVREGWAAVPANPEAEPAPAPLRRSKA